MSFVPYLHFQGNCADAMAFYAEIFGGEVTLMKYADAPADMFPEGQKPADDGRVMHAALQHAGGTLMASDFPPGMAGDPQQAVSVACPLEDVAEGQRLFDKLATGGTIVMPYGETFWAGGFGMVKDRFGTHWMISAGDKQPAAV